MKKKEILKYISERHNLTLKESKKRFKKVLALLSDKLKEDKGFTLPGLGTFQTQLRKGRKYYLPWENKYYFVPKKKVVEFHPSINLKEEVKYNKMARK